VTDTPTEREGEGGWAKLRRRKVVQWSLAYAAGAWLLLQVLAYVSGVFDWPRQVQQIAMLLILIGLAVVIVLAWYHGDKGEQRVTRGEVAVLAVLLLAGGGLIWWWDRAADPVPEPDVVALPAAAQPRATLAAADRSIAVLPFVNMSSDPEQEFFSDGISEQVLDLLSHVPELRVIARTSSFSFKNKDVDVATIAQRLNVSHVLEGSVRKSGNRVRITVQLIRATDSSHLWSNTYDRELNDIFAVQDEIAAAVVRQLKVALLGGELPARSATTNLKAFNFYLQGRYLYDRHTVGEMHRAVEFYQKAVEADPSYALAWADLGDVQWMLADEGYRPFAVGAREALASAHKALAIDPDLARAHAVVGMVRFAHDFEWAAADASFKRALAEDPGDIGAVLGASSLALGLGRIEEATVLAQGGVARSPIHPMARLTLAFSYEAGGKLAESEREFRTVLELSSEYASGWYWLGRLLLIKGDAEGALEAFMNEPVEHWRLAGLPLAYHALNRTADAEAALRQAIDKYADQMGYQVAQFYACSGQADAAFAWLERAYDQRDTGFAYWFKTDRVLAGIRDDPRYAAMLRRLNLPEG
jgi:TolB-like protein/tetratricopeptide (TPR) repeat protein